MKYFFTLIIYSIKLKSGFLSNFYSALWLNYRTNCEICLSRTSVGYTNISSPLLRKWWHVNIKYLIGQYFGGQNIRYQLNISAFLSAENLSLVLIPHKMLNMYYVLYQYDMFWISADKILRGTKRRDTFSQTDTGIHRWILW